MPGQCCGAQRLNQNCENHIILSRSEPEPEHDLAVGFGSGSSPGSGSWFQIWIFKGLKYGFHTLVLKGIRVGEQNPS